MRVRGGWRLCCLVWTLLLLAGSCLDVRPRYSFDIARAQMWRCVQGPGWNISRMDRAGTGVVILKRGVAWVELATDVPIGQMEDSLGLLDCVWLANVPSLLHTEGCGESAARDLVRTSPNGGRGVRGAEPFEGGTFGVEAWFTQYHNLSQLYQWYQRLGEDYPGRVTVNTSIGRTHYNYTIMAVHVTSKGAGQETRPTIYVQCLLHAREWITGPVCMYLAYYLASTDDLQVRVLLEKFQFIFVPVANPDGYLLTWLDYPKYRLWRKNVSPLDGTSCVGVDLNRNFDFHWNESDGSGNPCSEQYSGPQAASELETKAISNYLLSHAPVGGAIDFHSYYQEVLYPYAWTKDSNEHTSRMKYIAEWLASTSSQLGTPYTAGSMGSVYTAGGTFPDWLYNQGIRHRGSGQCFTVPLTIELRPSPPTQGNFLTGFLVPTSEILPTCKEMVPPLVKFGQLLLSSGCHDV